MAENVTMAEERTHRFFGMRMPLRLLCLRLWFWAVVISIVILFFGTTNPLTRLIHAGTLALGLFTGLLFLHGLYLTRRWTRIPILAFAMLFLGWVFFAGRPYDVAGLRTAYLSRLRAFTGTRYVWGGETHFGVDCSGLARTALWEAMVVEGVREGNPRLLGPLLWNFWGKDISARAMGEGVYGFTRNVGSTTKLAGDSKLITQPGDLGVTEDGVHVLIYLGDGQWIEANPDDGRVVINAATADSPRAYFNDAITIMRWRMLE
ncbi:MAG: NlpC/P60 family protein [Armatimonadota bacterium]